MTIESGTWMAEGPPQEETEAAVAHLLKEALILIRFELAAGGRQARKATDASRPRVEPPFTRIARPLAESVCVCFMFLIF
jgi:hypothetical protein